LCRLQKNDKWVRFFRNKGYGENAGAMAWGIFELMKASSFSKGYWCGGRPFGKLRVTDWNRSKRAGRPFYAGRLLTEGGFC